MDYFKVTTSIGDIWILPQGKATGGGMSDHTIYVELGYNAGMPRGTERTYLTVRGVNYHGSCHVFRWSDGLFHVGREWVTDGNYKVLEPKRTSSKYDRLNSQYFSREGIWAYGKDRPSDSARAVLVKAIEQAVNDWARTSQYILDAAEQERLTEERDRKLAKLEELHTQMVVLEGEIAKLESELVQDLVKCVSCGKECDRIHGIVECKGCGWSHCNTCHKGHLTETRDGKLVAEPTCIAAYKEVSK